MQFWSAPPWLPLWLRRAQVWGLALLPLLAVLARLAYDATLLPRIVVTFEADPITYDQIARNLVAGRGFSGARSRPTR